MAQVIESFSLTIYLSDIALQNVARTQKKN